MSGPERPRILLVSRGPYRLPLDPGLERRFAALSAVADWRQLAHGSGSGDPRFVLTGRFPVRRLDGIAHHLLLPLRVARLLQASDTEAVLVQGGPETALVLAGRALARSRAAVVCEVHGDWRAPARLYGSPARRLVAPLGDALSRLALRRADAVRTVTPYTTRLVRAAGVEPAAEFPAYMDLATFEQHPPAPLPVRPTAVYVGSLERTKGVDVLLAAWEEVVRRVPGARLHVVGRGTLGAAVAAARSRGLDLAWDEELDAPGVAAAMDAATCLVLPSLSEGMGRVAVEAFCRGRAVVGSDVGGIPDVVTDGVDGLLVAPGDVRALADALARVLGEDGLAARLGAGAAAASAHWRTGPDGWAARMRALVDEAVARRSGP